MKTQITKGQKVKTMTKSQKRLRTAYNKEFDRIRKLVQRGEKIGYLWEQPDTGIPVRPDIINYDEVRKLRKITRKRLYEQATFLDKTTGEVIPGTEAYKKRNKERARKSAETRKKNKELTENRPLPLPGADLYDSAVAKIKEIIQRAAGLIQAEMMGNTARPRSTVEEADRAVKNMEETLSEKINSAASGWIRDNTEENYRRLLSMGYTDEDIGKNIVGFKLESNLGAFQTCVNVVQYDSGQEAVYINGIKAVNILENAWDVDLSSVKNLLERLSGHEQYIKPEVEDEEFFDMNLVPDTDPFGLDE